MMGLWVPEGDELDLLDRVLSSLLLQSPPQPAARENVPCFYLHEQPQVAQTSTLTPPPAWGHQGQFWSDN